ncbi:MAG TPA: type II toxin-antitoxin system VapC family toxin [Tepidisphaeraceae bacterium]|jgi:PIN domain nuclease of toxin-antitoxin system|nr:type II toxin-antitoxin system VapC family toxin [Tepidisphaeraceae bacterium]
MRLLLDSQAFILILQRPDSLGSAARNAIIDPNNEIFLSLVTPIELQIKVNLKKLSFAKSVREHVQFELDREKFKLLPITLDHIDALSHLPSHHRDPFDRLLIAQAIHENLTIITSDQTISRYPVSTLWNTPR